ncbi:MAG: hypothetical protein M0D55_14575 [Elusimicrobiota bacterium]|nr:MAG: hypothetical protein M0D55_14575 [Elusimicrobiota bacterium]
MTALTIPFISKSNHPLVTVVCLALVGAAIALTIYLLCRHFHGHHKAKKEGIDRRHDGRHGNH